MAEQKLKSKPYDLDAWETLIKEAQVRIVVLITNHYFSASQTTALIRGRMLFEKLVERFPTCGRFWRIYIEQEVSLHDTYIEYCITGIAGHLLEYQLVSILPNESLHAVLLLLSHCVMEAMCMCNLVKRIRCMLGGWCSLLHGFFSTDR